MTQQEKFYGRINGVIDSIKLSIKWSFIISFWLVIWLFYPATFYPSVIAFAFYLGYKIWKWGNRDIE